jgi:hypothetical protein
MLVGCLRIIGKYNLLRIGLCLIGTMTTAIFGLSSEVSSEDSCLKSVVTTESTSTTATMGAVGMTILANDNVNCEYVVVDSQLHQLMISSGEYKEVHRLDTPDGVVVKMQFLAKDYKDD